MTAQSSSVTKLPNLVVLGAMKCATTSLHHYLDLHPEICMSRERGLNAFLEENLPRGLDWYRSHFDQRARIRGDTSPRYTNAPLDPGVASRMRQLLPDARLVYLVRDPVERMVSHYTHYVASGYESRPAAEALLDLRSGPERNPYLSRSLYWMQLREYLGHYPRSQLKVIYYEDLRDRGRDTLREIFRFLEVDEHFDAAGFDRIHHRTRDKRRLTPAASGLTPILDAALAPLPQDARDRVGSLVTRPFSRRVERPHLAPGITAKLRELLRDDSERVQAFVGRRARWRG